MTRRVLHLLSQRPALPGSGITLDALVRHGSAAGWQQMAIVGTPADDPQPAIGDLPAERIRPLRFAPSSSSAEPTVDVDIAYPIPGMSDVMPYPSSRFSALDRAQRALYLDAWRRHLEAVIGEFRPDIVHSHHAWAVSSLVSRVAPHVPQVIHGHGTALRQRRLAPKWLPSIDPGLAPVARFAVLHRDHAERYGADLGLPAERFQVVGAGFREDLFHRRDRHPDAGGLLYAGKLSDAKGLPWLLTAVENLAAAGEDVTLTVAGGGSGPEADELRQRMAALEPRVRFVGRLDQGELAEHMRRSSVFVLPSFFEGLPLVLVEALATGCRLVSTALPGVVDGLAPTLGDQLRLVPPPRLVNTDQPVAEDLPAFVEALAREIRQALAAGPADPVEERLAPFKWQAVFERVEQIWLELAGC
ncbi:MAG: glycosyltransferase family 4 protein [Acidobacteriota bacterium]